MLRTKLSWLILFSLIGIISILYSLCRGSVLISLAQLFTTFTGHSTPLLHKIIFDLRLPRTLSAFVTGGLLALAGAMMQVLLRNPLADPYILGISGGAAVASLLFILAGFSGYELMGGAWLGSLLAMFLVFTLTQRKTPWDTQRVLLTGVALASGFAAIVSFILLMSSEKELHGMLFWLLGDLSFSHFPILEGIILLVMLIISLGLAKPLNILVRGEREANALGINAVRLQMQIYFLSSLLTATAVALAGCIGFIGLVIPHLFRLLCSSDHRVLLPGCVLLGGSLLTVADTVARTFFAPQQLPVGIMMAIIGIPIFLFLLQKNNI